MLPLQLSKGYGRIELVLFFPEDATPQCGIASLLRAYNTCGHRVRLVCIVFCTTGISDGETLYRGNEPDPRIFIAYSGSVQLISKRFPGRFLMIFSAQVIRRIQNWRIMRNAGEDDYLLRRRQSRRGELHGGVILTSGTGPMQSRLQLGAATLGSSIPHCRR